MLNWAVILLLFQLANFGWYYFWSLLGIFRNPFSHPLLHMYKVCGALLPYVFLKAIWQPFRWKDLREGRWRSTMPMLPLLLGLNLVYCVLLEIFFQTYWAAVSIELIRHLVLFVQILLFWFFPSIQVYFVVIHTLYPMTPKGRIYGRLVVSLGVGYVAYLLLFPLIVTYISPILYAYELISVSILVWLSYGGSGVFLWGIHRIKRIFLPQKVAISTAGSFSPSQEVVRQLFPRPILVSKRNHGKNQSLTPPPEHEYLPETLPLDHRILQQLARFHTTDAETFSSSHPPEEIDDGGEMDD